MIKIHAGVLHILLTGKYGPKQMLHSPSSVVTDRDYGSTQGEWSEDMCF